MPRLFKCAIVLCSSLLYEAVVIPNHAQAQPLRSTFVPGARQADRHNPFSPGYTSLRPNGFAQKTLFNSGGLSYTRGSVFFGSSLGCFAPCDPWCSPAGNFCGPYDYGCGYGGYNCNGASFGFAQFATYPLVLPTELFLGPVLQQFAFNAQAQPAANNRTVIVVPPAAAADRLPARPRASNAETTLLGIKIVGFGDEHFSHQRYREALDRYRKATEATPDLVEAYFRHGQALTALGKYDAAATAFKRGIKLSDRWPQADFHLKELYGNNDLARQSHLEAVAAAAGDAGLRAEAAEPGVASEGELLLIVAMQLQFGDQPVRAVPFFKKAQELLAEPDLTLDLAWAGKN